MPIVTRPLFGGALDFTGMTAADSRSRLKPILNWLTMTQEHPLLAAIPADQPSLVTTLTLPAGWLTREGGLLGYGIFWGNLAVSTHVRIGGHFAFSDWQQDNIAMFGPALVADWGTARRSNHGGIGVSYLRGPDDFHFRNVNLFLMRRYSFNHFALALGWFSHAVECKVHIRDAAGPADNFSLIFKTQLHHFRLGVCRYVNSWLHLGIELAGAPQLYALSAVCAIQI